MNNEFQLTVMCSVDELSEGDSAVMVSDASFVLDEVDAPDIFRLLDFSAEHEVEVVKPIIANVNEEWELVAHADSTLRLCKSFRIKNMWPIQYTSPSISRTNLEAAIKVAQNNKHKEVIFAIGDNESEPHIFIVENDKYDELQDALTSALRFDFQNSIHEELNKLDPSIDYQIHLVAEGTVTSIKEVAA